jgi:hypothetical protein
MVCGVAWLTEPQRTQHLRGLDQWWLGTDPAPIWCRTARLQRRMKVCIQHFTGHADTFLMGCSRPGEEEGLYVVGEGCRIWMTL